MHVPKNGVLVAEETRRERLQKRLRKKRAGTWREIQKQQQKRDERNGRKDQDQ